MLLCSVFPYLLCSAASAAPLAAAMQTAAIHLLLLLHPRVIFSLSPVLFSALLSCSERATASPSTRRPPPRCRSNFRASSPYLSFPFAQQHQQLMSAPIAPLIFLAIPIPSSLRLRRPIPSSGELRVTVGSRHQAAIALSDTSRSFPDLCLYFPAPSRLLTPARAPLPTSAARRRLLPAVGRSPRSPRTTKTPRLDSL
jgi:hypothetical protein